LNVGFHIEHEIARMPAAHGTISVCIKLQYNGANNRFGCQSLIEITPTMPSVHTDVEAGPRKGRINDCLGGLIVSHRVRCVSSGDSQSRDCTRQHQTLPDSQH
jgi:hypothetical protein